MVIARAGSLIPAPFADWLRRRAAELGGNKALGDELGLHESRVRAWINGRPAPGCTGLVKVETVDRVLTSQKASIARVYGPLYDLAIPETDWCGESCAVCDAHLLEPALLCGFCLEETAAAPC